MSTEAFAAAQGTHTPKSAREILRAVASMGLADAVSREAALAPPLAPETVATLLAAGLPDASTRVMTTDTSAPVGSDDYRTVTARRGQPRAQAGAAGPTLHSMCDFCDVPAAPRSARPDWEEVPVR